MFDVSNGIESGHQRLLEIGEENTCGFIAWGHDPTHLANVCILPRRAISGPENISTVEVSLVDLDITSSSPIEGVQVLSSFAIDVPLSYLVVETGAALSSQQTVPKSRHSASSTRRFEDNIVCCHSQGEA